MLQLKAGSTQTLVHMQMQVLLDPDTLRCHWKHWPRQTKTNDEQSQGDKKEFLTTKQCTI
jgi:hypothetical protein